METTAILDGDPGAVEIVTEVRREEALLKALSVALATTIRPGFGALVFKAEGPF